MLGAGQHRLNGITQCVACVERGEIGLHGRADRDPGEGFPNFHRLRLMRGADPNEESNEEQDGIIKKADQTENKGQRLTDCRSSLRRPAVVHLGSEQSRRMRPPSIGKAGITLKMASKRLATSMRSRNGPPVIVSRCRGCKPVLTNNAT